MIPPCIIVVGGGAAGFFAAIAAAETHPAWTVILLERSSHVLAKVRVSGGGRCNVSHACFDPAMLVRSYPRGGQALLGPFSRFQPQDTIAWFESRGVRLKTEPDGRIFPVGDRSDTVIDCLRAQAAGAGVRLKTNALIEEIETSANPEVPRFHLVLAGGGDLSADRLVLATGSSPPGWEWARALGHSLVPPVPSLFTFTIPDRRLEGLSGLAAPSAELSLEGTRLREQGPVLITHWGLSGPAVLALSAWGARELHACGYQAALKVNWTGERFDFCLERLRRARAARPGKNVPGDNLTDLPRRLWARLVQSAGIRESAHWTEVGNEPLYALAGQLTDGAYRVTGKNAFKEEFVTCGGIPLDEVDFRTMESKRCQGLFFAGEILDIDGVTGGFNLQSAWTTGWIAGRAAPGFQGLGTA
jgi:predicted Rossmann fold flavoprotein